MTIVSTIQKRRTQAERATETKDRLISAALEVLRAKGYAGFRVADVTDAAALSRGGQTHHFPTKLDLLTASFARLYEQITERSRSRLAQLKPEDDVVRQMLDDASDFFLHDDFSIGLDVLAAADRDEELRDAILRTARENRFMVEDMWIGVLMSRGLSRVDAEDILWLVFNTVRGLAVRTLWQHDEQRFEHVKDVIYKIAKERYEARRKSP
ncbi:TetR/AcrR family transcriptional regulator [Aromatoleum aromaticum]|uniref:TetR/AcrR family transcriptional regulator n=1 Tax=Aromatoleum aromaticum TaxID=551760 RepID=UPI00169EDC22|nr:TetR/AcrR family transcriptional regulator [Aromatoleum aromaticum]NMG55525.1 TetR family transcriptional regulator [Aromatoleum aromaticum]